MTRIADEYHNNLQDERPNHNIDPDDAWLEVKEGVCRKLSQNQKSEMAQYIKQIEVEMAIKLSKKSKAAGIDGLPTELYQLLGELYRKKKGSDNEIPDFTKILTEVFNEIEKFGIAEETEFTKGWMCPIYI
jgi:hypothetical protein